MHKKQLNKIEVTNFNHSISEGVWTNLKLLPFSDFLDFSDSLDFFDDSESFPDVLLEEAPFVDGFLDDAGFLKQRKSQKT